MRLASRLFLPLSWIAIAAAAVSCGASGRADAEPRLALAAAPLVPGQVETDEDYARAIRAHYTKYEHMIPMRDGVRLFTVVYVPKDGSRPWPIMMRRTPYSVQPYGIDNYPSDKSGIRTLRRFAPSASFLKDGFIFVHQDVRGRNASEGTFVDVRPRAAKGGTDEATDAWDTIDWLVKNVPNNNGKVGVWGISYDGFYAAQAAIDAHPALEAVSPQAPVTEWFLGDDFHHNGVLFLADAFDFYASFGKPRPKPTRKPAPWTPQDHDGLDVYDFFLGIGPLANVDEKHFEGKIGFWKDLMEHPNRDAFWKARDPRPHYRDAKPAIMTVGGWFDAEDLFGPLETYRAFERGAKSENVLVMGPWRHGGWARTDGDRHGDVVFGQNTSAFYRTEVELPFFQRHLKDKKTAPPPEALVFETGTNLWQRYPSWPPPGATRATLFFREKGGLSTAKPGDAEGADAYVSDPKKPVPYRERPGASIDADYMSADQRFAARRTDVLVYDTGVLDADVTLAGPIEASLWITSTGTDADFVVKLIDVYASDAADPEPNPHGVKMGGYQQLVRAEVMRAKYRESFETPKPLVPNEPALVRFALQDVSHTFRAGHRIMVQVQSSWFPLCERNPQTFVDIPKAKESDYRVATHKVLRTRDMPSGITVTVARGRLP